MDANAGIYLGVFSLLRTATQHRDGGINLSMASGVKARFLIPGRLYRDLDGSIIHLVAVDREVCSWVAASDAEENRQVTHCENFRRRFRTFDDDELETKAAA
jgi:hypothetical protein